MGKVDIIKKVKTLRSEYEIAEYFKEEVPEEYILDEKFMEQLKAENPHVEEAVAIYLNDSSEEKINQEIEEKGLKGVIEDDIHNISVIPRSRREELYQLALEYEANEEYETAKLIYDRIAKFGKDRIYKFGERYSKDDTRKISLYYSSKFAYYVCKVKNGEELTPKDLKELEELVKEDKDNILNLTEQGKIKPIDFLKSFFKDLTLEELEEEILPNIGPETEKRNGEGNSKYHPTRPYSEALSPKKRLDFIKKNYIITKVRLGQEKLAGFVIIETEKNPDAIIVEKFFQLSKDKKSLEESKNASTYFIHNDADIDLTKVSVGELLEKRDEEHEEGKPKLIDRVYHRGDETYYERFDQVYSAIQNKTLVYKKKDDQEYSVEELETYIMMLELESYDLKQREKLLKEQIKKVQKEWKDEELKCDNDIEKIDSPEMEKAVIRRIDALDGYKELLKELNEELDKIKVKQIENANERRRYRAKLNAKTADRGEVQQ